MKKSWVNRCLVCGIILLFVVAGVSPIMSKNIEKLSNNIDLDRNERKDDNNIKNIKEQETLLMDRLDRLHFEKSLDTNNPSYNQEKKMQRTTDADGKGMWIWKIWELSDSVSQIISRLQSTGVEWVTVKCGDSDSYYLTPGKLMYNWLISNGYSDFSQVVSQFHSAGIRVLGWHYVYSYDQWGVPGVTEADVSNQILDIGGIDGLIIDAETQYEAPDKGPIAEQYMLEIRAEHPNNFIAYSTFARIDSHLWFPYIEFGRYCDAAMPQCYWGERPTTPTNEINIMCSQWNYWYTVWQSGGHGDSVKPVIPTGQGYDVPGSEISEFCEVVEANRITYPSLGLTGHNLYHYGEMTTDMWNAYSACGCANYPEPTISVSDNENTLEMGETDWVKFTITNVGTESTSEWGIQVKVGDNLELTEHSSYPWNQIMCSDKAAEWYKFNTLNPGDSADIWVGITGTWISSYESVWFTAWMHDPDGLPAPIQYSHDYWGDSCNRGYAEYGVEVISPIRVITFYSDPTNGGTITFDGNTYTNGQNTQKPDGIYAIIANPATNYAFNHWTSTGGVSVANLNSQTTTATITGDGTLKAWFTYSGPGTDTGWHSPTATGYNQNDWNTPENAYNSNDQYAVAGGWNSGQDYYNFGFSIPSGSTIKGIEIKLEGTGDGGEYVGKVKCRVMMGDMAWNETGYLVFPASEDAFHIVGGPSELWGYHYWLPTYFEDNAPLTFRVRLSTGADWHTCRIDHLQAKIYYEITIPQQRTITFYTDPTNGGTITFNGITYSNGQNTQKPDGTYTIIANPATNYAFNHWTSTGGVTVANPNSHTTTVTITADGTLKAWFTYTPEGRIILVPQDWPTIQQGVSMAFSGDTVLVSPGIYNETVYMREGVKLIGTNKENTIISGMGEYYVIKGADNSQISGFTIKNGFHGINCGVNYPPGSPEISDNIITEVDYAITVGGGAAPTIRNNLVTNVGGGIVSRSGSPIIKNNIFCDSTDTAIELLDGSHAMIINNVIDSVGPFGGWGIYIGSTADTATIKNNIFTNLDVGINNPDSSSISFSYNNFWTVACEYRNGGYWGPANGVGDLSVDPVFVDSGSHDYHLQSGSLCINAGDPNPVYNDPDDTRNDMGAYGGPSAKTIPKLRTLPNSIFHDFGTVNEGQIRYWKFYIQNSGGETLTWETTDDQTWITMSPPSGSTTTEIDTITVTIDTTGLIGGTHTGTITVSSNDGTKIGTISVYVPLNNQPYTPSNPDPINNSINVDITDDLSWTGGDPDSGDTVTYDVYFEAGDSTPDVLVSNDQSGTSYDPGTMGYSTTYYWQIVSTDNHLSSTPGPIWSFTTIPPPPPMLPMDTTPWHMLPQDKNKAVNSTQTQYTYTTNATTGSDLYFKFIWGDGQETSWLGPYNAGQPVSATHSWIQKGFFGITALVKSGVDGTPSNPSAALTVQVYKVGDVNNDGWVSWRDIDPFVTAMNGPSAYYAAFPTGYFYTADCNFDHTVNWRDIDPFVARMNT